MIIYCLDNEPGTVLRVLQIQMIHLACSLLGMGAFIRMLLEVFMVFWALDAGGMTGLGWGRFMGLGELKVWTKADPACQVEPP